MNERLQWVGYKGNNILYCDFRDLVEEEMIALIKTCDDIVIQSGKTDLLKINDVRSIYAMASLLPAIQKSAEKQKKYLKKTCYIGTKGIAKILDALNKMSKLKAKSFATPEEAMEWLVS